MSIQKNMLIIIFIMSVLIFLVNPGKAIDTETCKICHGYVIPLSQDRVTKDCMAACHGQSSHAGSPETRDPTIVHPTHAAAGKWLNQKTCGKCHTSNPDCTRCHNSHEISRNAQRPNVIVNPNVTANQKNMNSKYPNNLTVSDCINCHGSLPRPYGHPDFRTALTKSKHGWMTCNTCHINVNTVGNNEFRLHFKDLFAISIKDSINLCKICHSFEYSKLINSDHGKSGQICVDCHNPHTTELTGSKLIVPKETPTNISTKIDQAGNWITTKVPILKNTTVFIIIFIIIGITIAEHILSREEEGKKTAYHTVKVRDNEDMLKTMEIELKNQNVDTVNEILEANGVNILGMTMTKEDEKGMNIYKYVIFVNIGGSNEDSLIGQITTMKDVKSAIFTDQYEL